MKTQCETVLAELKKGRVIDTVWAFNRGICRLSARVMNLKARGYNIESVPLVKKDKRLPYCGYRLVR